MKVYVASSWRNEVQTVVVVELELQGHSVYDFKRDGGFGWHQIDPLWKGWGAEQYLSALRHPLAVAGFRSDMQALRNSDACVIVQPCGVSAALEFGWAVGAGKFTVAYVTGMREPDLMFEMAHAKVTTIEGIVAELAVHERRMGL